jgi:aminoacyl tRNA synthase complex-interacting multifunctional protein 1
MNHPLHQKSDSPNHLTNLIPATDLKPFKLSFRLRSIARILSRAPPNFKAAVFRRHLAMASLAISPADKALSLLVSSFKDLNLSLSTAESPAVSQLTLPNATVSGTNTIASHLASLIPLFASTTYTPLEAAEIEQWLTLSAVSPIPAETLDALNDTLKFRTTLLGEKWSVADVVVYSRVKDVVAGWSDEERTGEHGRRHVVRWVDFVQNSPALGLNVPAEEKVKIDASKVLFTPKPEEAPKKEKKPAAGAAEVVDEKKGKKGEEKAKDAAPAAAAAPQGKKTEKKQKQKREPAPPKEGMYHPTGGKLRMLTQSRAPPLSCRC